MIRVRHQDIVPIPGVPVPADVEWIPEPNENRAVAVFVVIARPDQGMLKVEGAIPLGGYTLVDGRAVLLVVGYPVLTEEQNRTLDKARAEALEMAPDDMASLAAPRMVAAGHMSDGTRSAWDMTLRPER